jgi:mannose-6-phosphate isomerase-like protein (cupin superfamily)
MKETIRHIQPAAEFHIDEGCHIIEMLQADDDPQLSIARARIEPGMTTRWHRLAGTTERYVISEGEGLVEVGSLAPQAVGPGDVVLIPPNCRQRITNTGAGDLLFLAICTPPFHAANYQDIEDTCPNHPLPRRTP